MHYVYGRNSVTYWSLVQSTYHILKVSLLLVISSFYVGQVHLGKGIYGIKPVKIMKSAHCYIYTLKQAACLDHYCVVYYDGE